MKVLVLGVTGMLGNAVFRYISAHPTLEAYGSARSARAVCHNPDEFKGRITAGVDVENSDSLIRLIGMVQPAVVINCVGLIKQLDVANDPLAAITINALLPHKLAHLCKAAGARLIHISTDCVFSGTKGGYLESDPSDAEDLYGKSKFLGEVAYENSITLRTSIIGHELGEGAHALLDWFLSQQGAIHGYSRAIFSGLPTVELARIIAEFVIPRPQLSGLYHVAAAPIDKYALLHQIAAVYGKKIDIQPVTTPAIDRSLDATRFNEATGYEAPPWPELIERMYKFR
ncbi:SDR family oxidoreductase [Burkholderia sp. L27(2015)]|uniref:dTDP-4-dehydrorhamnose reductase family protein n=1 Tax=Burkholderia sp. L27(2015) TaxID=1641858 RepID=UPI00131CC28B|nr:SDR family oxidoreductase [Burkholderia sp. L27(2015)]